MTEPQIITDPEIMFGKPVIKGTRITVEHVLRMVAQGFTEADIVDAHPHISVAQVRAAISYAADHMSPWKTIAAE